MMTDIERCILENQEVILLGLSKLLTPHCKGVRDKNGETHANSGINYRYHLTRKTLGKSYIKLSPPYDTVQGTIELEEAACDD